MVRLAKLQIVGPLALFVAVAGAEGAAWALTDRIAITGEIYANAADAATGRVVIRRTLGS